MFHRETLLFILQLELGHVIFLLQLPNFSFSLPFVLLHRLLLFNRVMQIQTRETLLLTNIHQDVMPVLELLVPLRPSLLEAALNPALSLAALLANWPCGIH